MGFLFKTKTTKFSYINMKILTTSLLTQTLSIIPRFYPALINYKIVNEETKVDVDVVGVATTTTLGFLTFDSTYSLDEDTYYELWVYDNSSGDIIYRDKIFCTDQTDYSINNTLYTEDTTYENEYLMYGN